MSTTTKTTLKAQAEAYIATLTANAEKAISLGHTSAYRSFGYTIGHSMARIFAKTSGTSRTALAFVDAEGVVRRADSWKQAGRVIGRVELPEAVQASQAPQ